MDTYFIAEVGVNHGGDLGKAKKMINQVSSSGAQAVKFQTYETDSRVSNKVKSANYVDKTIGLEESIGDMFNRLRLDKDKHQEIFNYARSKNIEVFSTPFDEASFEYLETLGVNLYKIASMDIVNLRLIKKCLKLRILIVSKYIKDKEKAVVIFTENIAHLKTNSINNHWVSSVLYFFATWSGAIYCKNNPEQAEIDLKLCEEFIYKRFDANVWTELIEEFYNAKKKFHQSTDQLDAFKLTCYEHKELISNTIGEKTKQYGDACFHIANYHLLVKEYESSLKYRLLRIKNYEDLYVNKPKPWSLQAAYMSTSFFYSKYLKDYKKGLDYALKALVILNNTQGIPDYSIAATYNRVFKAYIELEEYNAAIELALKHFEEVKNTENVPDVKLGFAYNLIAISYKWSAEKIKDKKLASSYFVAAIKHFNLAITSWSEDTSDQSLKRARASINVGLCEHEVLLIGLETKSINVKKIIEMIEKGLKEIKDPKLESFLTKPTKALIEKAEATLLNLSK